MKQSVLAITLMLLSGVVFSQEVYEGDYDYHYEDNEVDVEGVQGSLNSNSGNNNSNNLTVEGGQTTYNGSVTNVRSSRNTPSMAAPMVTSGIDTCAIGVSGAATGPGFGLSLGKTKSDKNCERLKLAKALQSIGLNDAAVAVLAQDSRVAEAIRTTYPLLAEKVIPEDKAKAEEERREKERLVERERFQRLQQENYEAALEAMQMTLHIFQKGDTLYSLARQYGTSVSSLMAKNPGLNPRDIDAGTGIII